MATALGIALPHQWGQEQAFLVYATGSNARFFLALSPNDLWAASQYLSRFEIADNQARAIIRIHVDTLNARPLS